MSFGCSVDDDGTLVALEASIVEETNGMVEEGACDGSAELTAATGWRRPALDDARFYCDTKEK
jgi:hypothetical protein